MGYVGVCRGRATLNPQPQTPLRRGGGLLASVPVRDLGSRVYLNPKSM